MKRGFNNFIPFLPGSAFTEHFGLLRTSSFERQNILSFDDLKSLFTFSWKEGREKWNSSGKVIVHLCHALSC